MSWRGPAVRGAVLLMETLWVYALVALLVAASGARGEPSLWGTGAVVFVSFLVSRTLQHSDLDLTQLRIWGTLASLLLFYVVIRVDVFDSWRLWDLGWAGNLFSHTNQTLDNQGALVVGVILLWAFWMRGILRGQEVITFEGVIASFAAGVAVIVFVELLAGAADAPLEVRHIAVPYVAVGLLTIGLTYTSQGEEDYARSFSPTWLAAVGGAVLAMTGISLIFVLIDFGVMTGAIIDAGRALGWLVGEVAYYLVYPIFWVLFQFFHLIGAILGQGEPVTPQEEPEPLLPTDSDSGGNGSLPAWARLLSRLLGLGVIGAVIIAGIALLFRRYDRRSGAEEVKESAYQEGRLAVDLGGMLGSMLHRLRPNLSATSDPARRLYFDMLSDASNRGVRRSEAETPLELAPRLNQAFAAQTPGRITSLFEDVRYGGLTPSPEQVLGLRQEWNEVKRGET